MSRWSVKMAGALVLGMGLLAAMVPAQARQASAPSAAASRWVPMLWEVKGQGEARVYLLGSTHLLEPADYPLPADVEAAYAAADRLVFELAPAQMQSPALATAMLRAGRRTDGRRLQDALPSAQWQALGQWAQRRSLPLQSLQGSKPWFVALNISLTEMAASGLKAELGLDRHLMARGAADGKPMAGLEDGLAQIALFDTLDAAQQQAMLAEALDDAGNGARMRGLLDAWRSGDVAVFWQQSGAPLAERHPALYQAINVARNSDWLGQLPQWLAADQGTTLMVVGALHLAGDDGLVARLRADGHAVTRVCTVAGCPPGERRPRRR